MQESKSTSTSPSTRNHFIKQHIRKTIALFHPQVEDRLLVSHAWLFNYNPLQNCKQILLLPLPCRVKRISKTSSSVQARSTNLWPFAKTLILRANSILVCFVDKGLPTPKVEENTHHKQLVLWCELGKEREPSKGSVLFKKLK